MPDSASADSPGISPACFRYVGPAMSSFAGTASENQFKTATTGARALTFDQSQLGAIVSGSFWLATRFRHKRMAAGLECSPVGATEGRPRRPA